ncbi:MAG: signal recognition particle protein [Firmicutes bacterium]|nr:signal recognition particle protein [Bacillota bacterium]
MFQSLGEKLQETFRKLRGKGKLTEADVSEAMREVRLALLEADVNFKVVKDFVKKVQERAVGQEVLQSLTPGQHVVKIVNDELTELMGGTNSRLNVSSKPPTVVMLVGLQGSGKTTTAGKLALMLQKQGRRPLLVAADVYRPAAIKQLQVLGQQLDIPVFSMGQIKPVDIVRGALESASSNSRDTVIIDTAGRLHINQELMDELKAVRAAAKPHEILLVVDAMTGQDAVNVSQAFHQDLGLDGVILTKLDGDTRGGAALSIRAVTGCPIKMIGVGEKLDALEPFYPDRMASRILGMGDVLTLIEKAQANLDQAKAEEQLKKLRTQGLTLEDFLDQLQQMKNMGPLDQLIGMIPGLGGAKQLKNLQQEVDPKELNRIEAIIRSMTPEERRNPNIIGGSRRKRIARGSGTRVQDVNRLLKQFEDTRRMMKQFTDMGGPSGKMKKGKGLNLPFFK